MRKKKNQTENRNLDRKLRDEAEEKLARYPGTPGEMQEKTFEEVIHELQVHQIELEMQNDELRKAQLALEESRQRYAELYDFSPVGYFTFTQEALIKEANLTGSALLGMVRQKLINARFRRIVAAKDQDRWDQHFLSVLQQEEKQTCDLMLKRQDGSFFYAGLESIRKEISRGAFEVHTTVTDITERKRMEEVVRQSEERYRTAIIEEIDEGYYEADLAGNFTFVNDAMNRQLQYSREELIGMNYRTYIPREEVEGVYKTFNRVYRTGEIVKWYPITNIRKDGTSIFVEDAITCRRDGEGRIIGFRGICRDVSERKRAEQALKESESRFRSIIENSKDGIIFFDGKTRKIILGNSAMAELLRCSKEDLVGRSIPSLHPSEEWASIEEEFQKHMMGELSFSSGIPVLRNDGSVFYADISSSLIMLDGETYFSAFFGDITERKQAEEALRESEEKYRILASSQDAMYFVDRECRYQFMNRAHLLRLGVSLGEVIGRSYGEFHSEKDTRQFADRVVTVFETGNAFQTEHRSERDNKYFLRTFGPVKDLQGNITGVTVISKDITERKQAEEALRESEKKYRLIVENSRDIIFMLGPSGEFIYLSPSISNVLGYDQSELIGHKFHSLIHPEDLPAVQDVLQRNMEEGFRTPGTKYRVRHASGEWRWYTARADTVRDEKGNFLNVTGVAQDITERKRAEEALRESEALYRLLAEHTTDIIWLVNRDLKTIYISPNVQNLRGFTVEEILEMPLEKHLTPESLKFALELFFKELPRVDADPGYNPVHTLELEYYRRDGTTFWAETKFSVIRDENGKPVSMLCEARDITERKRAEEALKISLTKYQTLFETLPLGITITDKAGKILETNKIAERLLGVPRKEHTKRTIDGRDWRIIRPDGSPIPADESIGVRALKENCLVENVERGIIKGKGDITWLNVTAAPIPLEDYGVIIVYSDITGRKQVEKEIEDLARFPQENPNPVLRVEPDGLIIYANEASKPLLFYWNTNVGGYLPTSLCKLVVDTLAGKTKITVDISCGELVFSLLFSPIRDTAQVNIYGLDITERKRLEEILKKEQQELKLIVDSSPIIVFYKDKEGKFIRINKAFSEAHKRPEEEFMGKTVFDLYSAKIAQDMTNDDQEVIKTGHPKINIIEQYESASGLRWVQTDKIPTCDKNGMPFGLIGFAQDITERKQAEESLRESEKKYRLIAENIVDVIAVLDMNLRFTFVSPSILRTRGFTVEEAMEQTLDQVMTPESLKDALTTFEEEMKLEASGTADPNRIRIREVEEYRKDGSSIWMEISLSFLRDKNQKAVGILSVSRDISERKQAEEALQRSEEKYRLVVENAKEAIIIAQDLKMVFANRAAVDMIGYSGDISTSKFFTDFIHPDDRNMVADYHIRRMEGEEVPIAYSFRVISQDGTVKWVEFNTAVIQWKERPATLSFLNDITARKQAEEALRESEKYFKEITENSSDMIIITDKNGDIKYCSRSVERYTGYKPEELIDRSGFTFIHPDDVERAVSDFGKAILTADSAIPNAFRMVHKDGSERYCDGYGKNLLDNPAIAGFVMNIRDITERKKAEEDVKKAEEKYRNIFENAIEGVFQTTPDGRYLTANAAQAHMLGYNSPEELIKSVDDISTQVYVKKESRDYFLRILEERGFIRGYEVEFFRKDGSTIWVSSNARVIRDENGKTVYYEGFNADITERKRALEELRIYQKELQALAIRMTEVEETERKEIARTLHDLVGQNLTALNLNLNIIFEMMTEDQKSLFSSRLEDSQKLLEETTQHIREVMSDLRPSVLDDFGLLAALHWYGQRFQGRTGIQTNMEGEEFYPRLSSVMETIIFRITQEVLTNVFKHASASRVNLRLGKTGNMVQLTITDNGKGFRFGGFRIGGEKRGWGMATMKERAVALGGNLQVFSEADKGTQIILQLPVEG